ncbi:hypothetical protein BGZ65_004218, partial [Modicella reniformis]
LLDNVLISTLPIEVGKNMAKKIAELSAVAPCLKLEKLDIMILLLDTEVHEVEVVI